MCPGPAPNRKADQSRERDGNRRRGHVVTKKAGERRKTHVDPEWHPIARNHFTAAEGSGQSLFYESTDWETLFLACKLLSDWLKRHDQSLIDGTRGPSVVLMQEVNQMFGRLLFSEADRRRAGIELEADESSADHIPLASVTSLMASLKEG